jgi:hypothetical protein
MKTSEIPNTASHGTALPRRPGTPPLGERKMRKAVPIFLGIALLLAGIAFFALPRIGWSGAAVCTLDIVVKDAQGNPIPNTTVILKYADFSGDRTKNRDLSNYHITRNTTDRNGHSMITHAFPAGGYKLASDSNRKNRIRRHQRCR